MSNYDLIDSINMVFPNEVFFEKIEGISVIGSYRSGADVHPIQYYAKTNVVGDDPYEGIGWTPSEALRNLYKELKYTKDHPYDPEEEDL